MWEIMYRTYVAVRYTAGAFEEEVRAGFLRVRSVSIHVRSIGVSFEARDLGIVDAIAGRVLNLIKIS